ncbi:serpin family protein [bacterium]|nr:serpin family protein [bacterium]
MPKTIPLILSLLILMTAALPAQESAGPAERVARANTLFAADLYRHLSNTDSNILFSPYSLSSVLVLIHRGATGATQQEIGQTLRIGNIPDLHSAISTLRHQLLASERTKVKMANAIWAARDLDLKPEFSAVAQGLHQARAQALDFDADPEQARQTINAFTREATKGKIPELIPLGIISAYTRLILTNALYFRSQWESPFDPEETAERNFRCLDGEKRKTPMMHQRAALPYGETDGVQILELPYQGAEYSLCVLLPRKIKDLPALEERLGPEEIADLLKDLEIHETDVRLPRFHIDTSADLANDLALLGMPRAFSSNADFSGMLGKSEDVYLTAVLHSARIDIDEAGTEAVAATAAVLGLKELPANLPRARFHADHPFLFLIRHRPTNTILFLGRMADPR